MMFHYTSQELKAKFQSLGIGSGDTLFVTTGLGFLGRMKDVDSLEKLCSNHLKLLQDLVGLSGTLVIPTYSYSFGKDGSVRNNLFNAELTPSGIGDFPNYVIGQKDFIRTLDPMMSVCLWGLHAENLADNLPNNSYGFDCIFERLLYIENMKCLSIGLGPNWTPFIHYFDYLNGFDYRYDKLFCGLIQKDSVSPEIETVWNYSVPAYLDKGSGNCQKLGRISELNEIWKSSVIGKSHIYCSNYREYFLFAMNYAKHHMWPTTLNSKQDIAQSEVTRLKSLLCGWNNKPIIENKLHSLYNIYYNGVSGYSLSKVFDLISKNIQNVSIDYVEVLTGSNVDKYVVPESIRSIGLELRTEDNEIIFSSQDEGFISAYVLPSSCSYEGSLNEVPNIQNYCNFSPSHAGTSKYFESDIFDIYHNLFRSEFRLTVSAIIQLLKLQSQIKQKITINYKSARFFSSIEFIVIIPNQINNLSKSNLCCIDTLILTEGDIISMIVHIEKLIAEGNCVICSPLGYAPSLFKANTQQNIKSIKYFRGNSPVSDCQVENEKTAMTINPTPNSKNCNVNTLDFLIT